MVWGWGTNHTVLIAVDNFLENPPRFTIILIHKYLFAIAYRPAHRTISHSFNRVRSKNQ